MNEELEAKKKFFVHMKNLIDAHQTELSTYKEMGFSELAITMEAHIKMTIKVRDQIKAFIKVKEKERNKNKN